jgi:hypothetical protein
MTHREKLDIQTDFGVHLAPTPWKDIAAAVGATTQILTR